MGYEGGSFGSTHSRRKGSRNPHLHIPPRGIVERASTDSLATSHPHVATALRFIRDHAAEPIGMDDIVRQVPMSRSGLEKKPSVNTMLELRSSKPATFAWTWPNECFEIPTMLSPSPVELASKRTICVESFATVRRHPQRIPTLATVAKLSIDMLFMDTEISLTCFVAE